METSQKTRMSRRAPLMAWSKVKVFNFCWFSLSDDTILMPKTSYALMICQTKSSKIINVACQRESSLLYVMWTYGLSDSSPTEPSLSKQTSRSAMIALFFFQTNLDMSPCWNPEGCILDRSWNSIPLMILLKSHDILFFTRQLCQSHTYVQ